jgi:triacylglycerol lipase
VILVHGTFANQEISWNALRPLLRSNGYCVFSLNYGTNATAPMAQSGDEVAAFARQVLAQTGAAKVSFVGHSQGGSLSRYVAKDKGLLDQTDDVIGLAPSSHGTTRPLAALGTLGAPPAPTRSPARRSCRCSTRATPGGELHRDSTTHDESSPLSVPGADRRQVTNVVPQDRCPNDQYRAQRDHLRPGRAAVGRNALPRRGPAARRPDCWRRRSPLGAGGTRAGQ